jgi:hypothetical protein
VSLVIYLYNSLNNLLNMKKVLICFVALWSQLSFGQVLTEDFESSAAPALPPGWTATTQATNGYTGYYTGSEVDANAAGYWPVTANGSTSFAMTNDDVQNDILCDELLISPSMDFSSQANLQLDFKAYHDGAYGSGDATVEVSTDGGTTWNVELTLTPAASWENYSVNLSAYDGIATVWIGFRWNDGGDCAGTDNWGTGLAIDDVVVDETPSFDVSMSDNSGLEYTIIPLDQLSGPFGASGVISNVGAADVTNISMTTNVYDAGSVLLYTASSNPTSVLASGSDYNASVPGYTPTADGLYTVELIANVNENDANLINDTVTYSIIVTNTYARDNGSVDVSLGVGAGTTAILGNTYEILSPTTLSSVSFFMIPGIDGLGDSVRVSIYDVVAGIPTSLITQSELYIISDADTTVNGAFLTLSVLDNQGAPFDLGAGTYYVGVNEYFTVDNMALGQSLSIETPNTCFGSINGAAFEPMENFGFPGPFIVRPNFACTVNTVSASECTSYTWSANNETYTESGEYTELFSDVSGCDSLVTLNLIITGPSVGIDVQSACGSLTWIDGNTYTENNNSATFLLSDSNGCDSTVTLDLTISTPTTGVDTQVACGDYEWIDGNIYTEANNTATFTLLSAAGCDSVVTLDLTITSLIETTDVQEACASFTWVDGNTYTESTTATFMLVSSNGCDSLVTLDLTIVTELQTTDVQEACGEYTWTDGITYSESNNTANQTLQSVGGCDSIVTLDLTILPLPDNTTFLNGSTIAVDAFASSYTWVDCATGNVINGETSQTFTALESGEYQVIIEINGCENTSECVYVEVETSGLLENESEFDAQLYPNPSNGIFKLSIEGLNNSRIEISVTDVSGKVIYVQSLVSNSSKLIVPMNISNVEEGVYFVRVNGVNTITKRVVVSHN